MTPTKLDLKDKKILEALDINARYFISDIAKKVKLNKEVVKYRIHNLEKKGVIKGYNTVINYSKLGLKVVHARLNLMDVTRDTIEEILDFIRSSNNLESLRECDVSWDIIFSLVVRNLNEFERFYNDFKVKFRRNIEFDLITVQTGYMIFSRKFIPDGDKQRIKVDLCSEKEDFDSTDIAILKIIAYDAKCPLIDIAKNLKLDSMTVKRRIDTMLKKKIIAGFMTKLNPKAMGISNYSIRLHLYDMSRLNSFREYLSSLPQTVRIQNNLAGYDFEFNVEVTNYFELEDMMNDIKKNFPIIREVVRHTTLRTCKPNLHEYLDKVVELDEA